MNHINEFLDFYARLFWCRWDKAIVNWLAFYLIAVLLVYSAAKYGALIGGAEAWYIHLLSLTVTIISALGSLKAKNQTRKLNDEIVP